MSEKITIRYTTSDNRIIVLSESDNTPDRPSKLSNLEKIKLAIEVATFLAITATLCVYAVLTTLQYKANKIYQRQTTVALDTEQRQLRAYLHVVPTIIELSGSPSIPTKVTFDVINDGETPAHNVVCGSSLEIDDYPLNQRIDLEYAKAAIVPKGYIASHCSLTCSVTMDGGITREIAEEMANNSKRLYLFGEIEYTDIFDIKRHLRFGWSAGGDPIKPALNSNTFPISVTGDFEYDPSNNYEY